jgi:tripartite-type tricarboxylate transporter receptor subunit TctC
MPEVRERLTSQGVDAKSSTADEFVRLLASDFERWARVVQKAGIRAE